MCPSPFNPLQENENGGYCSAENAIRERRAYGPELSHEDFTKFHEVWCQRIHKKHTSFPLPPSLVTIIYNHIPSMAL